MSTLSKIYVCSRFQVYRGAFQYGVRISHNYPLDSMNSEVGNLAHVTLYS